MKLFFFLIFLHVLPCVLSVKPEVSDDNLLTKKWIKLMETEKPSTPEEILEIACFAWACHFKNIKGCRAECNKLAGLRLNVSEEDSMDAYDGDDAKLCTADCIGKMKRGEESKKVCAKLCEIETSHSDRDQWKHWWNELLEAKKPVIRC